MKDLTLTINESISTNISDSMLLTESYKNVTDNFNDLTLTILSNVHPDYVRAIKTLIKNIESAIEINPGETKPKMRFVFHSRKLMFKIPYKYADVIPDVVSKDTSNLFYCTKNGVKVNVYMKGNGYDKRKRVIFQTGVGSVDKITTKEQETAFCLIWNVVHEQLNEITDTTLTNDLIREVIGDLSDRVDDGWIHSWSKTIGNIVYLIGTQSESSKNYISIRAGGNVKNHIGNLHNTFVKKYGERLCGKGTRKDRFDPTDVILYDRSMEGDIMTKLKGYTNDMKPNEDSSIVYNRCLEIKNKYFNELVASLKYIPISLKKLSIGNNGSFGFMNVTPNSGSTCSVNGFTVDKNNKDRIDVLCDCNVCFTGQTDGEGNELTDKHGLVVVMRSFQKDNRNVDIDVTLDMHDTPTLGKCPRKIWQDILGVDNSNKEESLKAFNTLLAKETDETKDILKQIIQGAIKQGPSCFPFLLIH
jgi:hypothetical protein